MNPYHFHSVMEEQNVELQNTIYYMIVNVQPGICNPYKYDNNNQVTSEQTE